MSKRKLKKNKNIFHNNTPLTQDNDTDTMSKLYDIPQTARKSGLSESHIRKIINEGDFKDVYKDGKKFKIVYDSFMKFIQSKYGTNTAKEQVNNDITNNNATEQEEKGIPVFTGPYNYSKFPKKDVIVLDKLFNLIALSIHMYRDCVGKGSVDYEMLGLYIGWINDMLLTMSVEGIYNTKNAGGHLLVGFITYKDIAAATNFSQQTLSGLLTDWDIKPVKNDGSTKMFDKEEIINAFKTHNIPFDYEKILQLYDRDKLKWYYKQEV